MMCPASMYLVAAALLAAPPDTPMAEIGDLASLLPGRTAAQNSLWTENPLSDQFRSSKRVVVADIKGPATITMIHFAMPETMKLNRDLLLKIYWDGETSPSVDCPMVDFFCDPAGLRAEVNTAPGEQAAGLERLFPHAFP